jgi:Mrp family chromosome partitioning ATPase
MWHHSRPASHRDRLRDEHRHMTTSAHRTLETTATGRPHRADIVWVSARARNVLRRPAGTLLRALLIALATMAVLVFLPRQSQRQAALLLPDDSEWVDTLPLFQSLAVRREALQRAEAELAATRDSALRQRTLAPPPPPILTADERARSDSLRRVGVELAGGLDRVHAAPLLASYRALGESEALRNATAARAILDSLADVERRRESFGTTGGTDPAYVALTTRANELGRTLESMASDSLASVRAALTELNRPREALHPLLRLPPVDTTATAARVALAREQVRVSLDSLEVARLMNREYVRRIAAARRSEVAAAPPLVVLAGGLVVGFAVAYLLAFVREVRHPRVGSVAEVERLTGTRVLALAGPRHEVAEWNRRRADADSRFRHVKPHAPAYRTIYMHLTATGAVVPLVTVTGSDPNVNGVVAANVAAAAASDGRATLLVDLDQQGSVASRVVRQTGQPGVANVRRGEIEWAEGVNSVHVGRGRLLDVISSGANDRGQASESAPQSAEHLRRTLTRMAQRYDLTVLSAPLEEARKGDAGLISTPDALVCITLGVTTHRMLRDAVEDARGGGLRVMGVVVWEGGRALEQRS